VETKDGDGKRKQLITEKKATRSQERIMQSG